MTRLKHISRDIDRHGRVRYYLRRPDTRRVRIREEMGTPEFLAAYEAILAGHKPAPKPHSRKPKKLKKDPKAGLIYFVQNGKAVKIGFTNNLKLRLKHIQLGSHRKIELLRTIPGDENTEREIHWQFGRYRIRGEWFWLKPDLQEFIQGLHLSPPIVAPESVPAKPLNNMGLKGPLAVPRGRDKA
jgi:hypothetical protein